MAGLEVLYLFMFVVGFSGSAVLVWLARRKGREALHLADEGASDELYFSTPSTEVTTPVPSRATPTKLPAVELDEWPSRPPVAQLLFATSKRGDHKECPKCKRRFGETVVLCPFDSAPLRSLHLRSRRTTRPATTTSRRPCCSGCGRRYEGAAKYCYHDGIALTADSPSEVPIVRACRTCGHETLDAAPPCECDQPDVVEIDPSRASIQMPTIPLMQCRRCDYLTAAGSTICPNDGELLYPVMNVQMNALPPTGIGPRRRVCEQCGRKFSTAANYCAYDGTKLKDLN